MGFVNSCSYDGKVSCIPSLKVKLDYIIFQKSYDSGGRDQMQVVPLYIIIYLLKSQNLIAYYKI